MVYHKSNIISSSYDKFEYHIKGQHNTDVTKEASHLTDPRDTGCVPPGFSFSPLSNGGADDGLEDVGPSACI